MKEIDRAKKEEFERKTLIESLEKMPARVVATAYLYAMNYELYGEDVTKKWQTAVQNTASLQRAYLDGRRDEAQRRAGYPVIQPVPREALNRLLITHEQAVEYLQSTGWMQEHDRQMMLDGVHRLTVQPEKRTDKRTETHACDSISRQAAIDAVQNRHMMLSKEKVLLINDLEKLPPAEPKRITGHWIFDNQYLFAWKCSVCGQNPTRGMGIVQGHDELYKYCPHCGAKMEKEVTE